jgi:hypothetical protein
MCSRPSRFLCGAIAALLLSAAAFAQRPNYQQNIDITAAWLASDRPSTQSTPSNGSITVESAPPGDTNTIEPYFANLAAAGWTKDPAYYSDIQSWMNWYWAHVWWPDPRYNNLYGAIDDFSVNFSNGTFTESQYPPTTCCPQQKHPDSTDSYAGTLLSLAWEYYQTGDDAHAYITKIQDELNYVGEVVVDTKQANDLTWASPGYDVEYLMDNTEAYSGLKGLGSIYTALGSDYSQPAAFYQTEAKQMSDGIEASLWSAENNYYYQNTTNSGPTETSRIDWGTWYPDAVSQLYPIANGVISPDSSRAQQLYRTFNAHWAIGGSTNWPTLAIPNSFPWALVAYVAVLMGDRGNVNTYINTVQLAYVDNNFNPNGAVNPDNVPYAWSCNEAGWFMRVNAAMLGK